MDALGHLATVADWTATSDDDRATALAALAASLGDGWRAGRIRVGRAGLGELICDSLGQRFVAVPGGWLRMGLSCDDLFVASCAREEGGAQPTFGRSPSAARPTRWVRMRPFLLAIAGVPPEGEAPASDGGHASKAYRDAVQAQLDGEAGPSAQELVDAYEGNTGPDPGEPPMRIVTPEDAAELVPEGFRMVSEAELEWAFREGGTTRWIGVAGDVVITADNRRKHLLGDLVNGFGLVGFRDLQNLCADGAVDYDVASPTDQDARGTDAPNRIARWAHTYWQSDDQEMFAVLAGSRSVPDEYGDSILRLACDLPGAAGPTGAPPGPLAEHALTIAGLAGDARAQGDALSALGYLARGRGDDVAPTVEAVLAVLLDGPPLPEPTRVDLLMWLADVQTGGHRDQTVQPPERKRRHALREDRAAARAAVAAAGARLAALLDDPSARVRSAATLALTFCVDADAATRQALAARLGKESEVGVQAALLLALIRLGVGFRAPAPEPLIRGALAVATAFDGPPNLPELLAAMRLPPEPNLAFNFGQLGAVAVGILRRLDAEVQREAAPEVAAWAAERKDAQLAEIALDMAFGEPGDDAVAPRLPDELASVERRVAQALVGFDAHELRWSAYGLPAGRVARRRYFGLDEAGPFDRFVTVDGREVPLWFAVAHAAHAGATIDWDALCADAGPAERLAIRLDRSTYGSPKLPWKLDDLLAAVAGDLPAARALVDAQRARAGAVGLELLRALVATRPGEPLDSHLLAEVSLDVLAQQPALFASFSRVAVEARLFAEVKPLLERALASDTWSIGVEQRACVIAAGLGAVASPRLARNLLLLGWASGQPAEVREAVGNAGGHHAAIAEVLTQYDALPEFTSWPRARAVLPTYAE